MSKNKRLNLHISGMHCASCASLISHQLSKINGVSQANVNYGSEQASVEFNQALVDTKQLIDAVDSLGYQAQEQTSAAVEQAEAEKVLYLASLRRQVMLAAMLTLPLIVSMFPGSPNWLSQPWLMFLLATPIQFWLGRRFYLGAWSALKNSTASMDTLVTLGTSAAYFYSTFILLASTFTNWIQLDKHYYFEVSAAVLLFVTLGKYLEAKAKAKTSEAVKALINLQPNYAFVKKSGKFVKTALNLVRVGDVLLVKPGQQVPVDGKIIEGETTLDESMVTGESLPVQKSIGQSVIGATLNVSGSFEMEATQVGEATLLSKIIQLVRTAQGSRPPVQELVDRVAAVFVPIVLILALLSFCLWWWFGPEPKADFALTALINVLIIACPCALGLATPTSLMVGVGKAAKQGILIKNAQVLETARQVKAVVFDKTGTLTVGKPSVVSSYFVSRNQVDRQFLLNLLGKLEERSHHPLAIALTEYVAQQNVVTHSTKVKIEKFSEIGGLGVSALVDRQLALIGNKKLLDREAVVIDPEIKKRAHQSEISGQTVVYLVVEQKVEAVFGLADVLRPEAAQTVQELKKMGIISLMLSGDNQITAQSIAQQAAIDQVLADVLPTDKAAAIEQWRAKYGQIAMVGDGINDAPALALADVGIAMGEGTDIAIESADIALLRNKIELVPAAIKISQQTIGNIKQNLFWAFAYNLILIPIAMGILYPNTGLLLNPMLAGAAMAFSSVSVVLNALRLNIVKTR